MSNSLHLDFKLLRVPFFLEPGYPRQLDHPFEESNRERLERKWGGALEFQEQKSRHRLKERGKDVGIEHFNLDRLASSTRASHDLVQFTTRTYGTRAAERLYSSLNFAHFEEGKKLNSTSTLLYAMESLKDIPGFDSEGAFEFLKRGDKKSNAIDDAVALLSANGIHSIPTFIFGGGQEMMGGAAHAKELLALFLHVKENIDQQLQDSQDHEEAKIICSWERFSFQKVLAIPDDALETFA